MTRSAFVVIAAGMCVFAGVSSAHAGGAGQIDIGPVDHLRCEHLENPLGIDVASPRLSWVIQPDIGPGGKNHSVGLKQAVYRILVASTSELLAKDIGDLWDSDGVASDASVDVAYAGKPLRSHQACYWKVRIWTDPTATPSSWSQPAKWTMGILDKSEWQGKWLAYTKELPYEEEWTQTAPSPMFRKAFALPVGAIQSATVSVCGLGFYELHLNGAKVGDHVLDPAFTRYDKRTLYVTYDVTKLVNKGPNVIGVMLGNGWYNSHSRCVWDFDKAPWRDRPKLLLQLRVVMADGTVKTIATDETWKANIGPVIRDGIRNGEVYDARREMNAWDGPGFNDKAWAAPDIVDGPKGVLRAQMIPPAKVVQTVPTAAITEPKPGVYIFDMGQNLSGWARLKVSGPAGQRVVMRYSERLDPNTGMIERSTISKFVSKGPFQTDTYILKGMNQEVFEPHFSYHGFQYVEVTGLTEKPSKDTITACVVHNAFEPAGGFECSNDLLNKIQKLTLWSYYSNFVDGYPTDCPQREKNGWTGDAHLAAEQAMFNFDNAACYEKWMNDFKDEQQADGNLPGIVPTSGWGYKWGNGPAWDSAYVLIPWYLYEYLGDTRVLAEHYDGMKRYVDMMTAKSTDHLVKHGLGDWVPAKTKTPEIVTSSGYYFVDATIVSKAAALLGKADDARKYAELADAIRQSFNKTLYKGDGIYANGSQTALSCALYQGLVSPEEKARVVAQLAANVQAHDGHLDTGILGAKYLFRALSDNGQGELAYRIATQTTAPSYGDWIRRGATTLWEDWGDGQSRNHIMFGDISAWFYQTLAGINADPNQPGFRHFIIRPQPLGDLTWVKAQHKSPYGMIGVEWKKDGGKFSMDVMVPVGATATIYVPQVQAGSAARPEVKTPGIKFLRIENGCEVYEAASGTYRFAAGK